MLRALMDKIDNMQDQMSNLSRQVESLINNNKIKIKARTQKH